MYANLTSMKPHLNTLNDDCAKLEDIFAKHTLSSFIVEEYKQDTKSIKWFEVAIP